MRRFCSCFAVLLLAASLIGCGGGGRDRAVVRVGSDKITEATFEHWMSVMAPEHAVPDPPSYKKCIAHIAAQAPQSIAGALEEECRQRYQILRQRVLSFLISSRWLIEEASERGLKVSAAKLDAEAQLSSARIRQALKGGEPRITQAQIVAYYQRNLERFGRRERRYIDIVERLASKAAASRALGEVVHRGTLSRIAIHEVFDKTNLDQAVPAKRAILRAIFTARPHSLIGPLPLNEKWCFFEVTRVIPAAVKPLAQVQGAVEQRLAGERRRRTLAQFISAWRRKWIARTDCSPGYVVQKCRQYSGARTPEDPVGFN
jgi:foldase protein PrsA